LAEEVAFLPWVVVAAAEFSLSAVVVVAES
jgi:hypothetical protein